MAASIRDLETSIRGLINKPWKQSRLLRSRGNWYKLCSSLDVIGDTELALSRFLGEESFGPSPYISIYGVMQLLFVQQGAIAHLAAALEIEYSRNPELSEIRDLRNISTGHPSHTSQGLKGVSRFSFIVRPSVTNRGFQLMTTYSDGREPSFRHVSLPSLIEKQRVMVSSVLIDVINTLSEEEMSHDDAFSTEHLEDVFPDNMDYSVQKMFEAANRPDMRELGQVMVDDLLEVLATFRERLKKRDEHDRQEAIDLLADAEWPLRQLRDFYAGEPSNLEPRSAHIFVYYCRDRLDSARKLAKLIDEEYAGGEQEDSDPSSGA